MGELVENQTTWVDVIEQAAPRFNEIATRHKLVTWAEESQFASQAIQKSNKLAQCQVSTVQNAIINVAAIGLTLNPSLGYAYLVPESVKHKIDNRDTWINECSLRVSFKGLLKIATDSGSIKWVKAEVVKESDTFNYHGPCKMPEHIMQPFGNRGNTVGVYCVAKTHDGDILVDVMDSLEITKIRSAAKTKYVWDTWPDEMAKKAIIKRASKQWPKTDRDDRLDLAVAAVNEAEGSEEGVYVQHKSEPETITEEQLAELLDAAKVAGVTEDRICRDYKIEALKELPKTRYNSVNNRLKKTAMREQQ